MYEPIRRKSVHTTVAHDPDVPHRTREEELDIQLAGHLAALLAITDQLRTLAPDPDLDAAADRLVQQVARLRGGEPPERLTAPPRQRAAAPDAAPEAVADLHRRAHALAGRALVVAASRADTAGAILAAERMDAHAGATRQPAAAS